MCAAVQMWTAKGESCVNFRTTSKCPIQYVFVKGDCHSRGWCGCQHQKWENVSSEASYCRQEIEKADVFKIALRFRTKGELTLCSLTLQLTTNERGVWGSLPQSPNKCWKARNFCFHFIFCHMMSFAILCVNTEVILEINSCQWDRQFMLQQIHTTLQKNTRIFFMEASLRMAEMNV